MSGHATSSKFALEAGGLYYLKIYHPYSTGASPNPDPNLYFLEVCHPSSTGRRFEGLAPLSHG